MKKSVRLLSLASCLIMMFTFIGCRSDVKVADDEQFLQVFVGKFGYGDEWMNIMLQNFAEKDYVKNKYPNFKYHVDGNSEEDYPLTVIEGGQNTNTVDLFLASSVKIGGLYEKEISNGRSLIEPIDDVYNAIIPGENIAVKDKMYPDFVKNYQFTKKDNSKGFYSMPWSSGEIGLLYNKTAFATNGYEIPNTTNELFNLSAEIKADQLVPFVFSSKTGYWKHMYNIWWAQYEGMESYTNYFLGQIEDEFGDKQYSTEIFYQLGLKRSLETVENLISTRKTTNGVKNNFAHDEVNLLEFTKAQSYFLTGNGLMHVNGDWFDNEMRANIESGYVNSEITFMPTPVISSIVETLENKSMTDDVLSLIITEIDAGNTSSDLCSMNDFNKIKAARNIKMSANAGADAVIPSYATAKEVAKEFLVYMASDEALEIYASVTKGASLPFNYNYEANTELYSKFSTMQKDRIAASKEASWLPNPYKAKAYYYGGLIAISGLRGTVDSLFTATNDNDYQTAEQIFENNIKYWEDSNKAKWNLLLERIY